MNSDTSDRAAGCLLGLALGDACGAPHEGGPAERIAWSILGLGSGDLLRWTDDTQMAVALAESLAACKGSDPDDQARRWADAFDPLRGYGSGARALLTRIKGGQHWKEANRLTFPEGSLGNGAAMRSAPLGVWYRDDPVKLDAEAARSAAVTHAHRLGIEGGRLIARAVAMAMTEGVDLVTLRESCREPEYQRRIDDAEGLLGGEPTALEVRRVLGARVVALDSTVTAVYAYLRYGTDFEDLMRFVISLGGDTDTIGAMAGGIYGAARGVAGLPTELLERLEDRARIEAAGRALVA